MDASGEFYHDPKLGPMPIGLGARVPMRIVSPWTRGGYVCSQVFDHTSVLRFFEARFGEPMYESNTTPCGRAVCGDLTSTFDFSKPNASFPRLPDTSHYRRRTEEACRVLPDPAVPKGQTPLLQEPGTRPARAIPYHPYGNGTRQIQLDASSHHEEFWDTAASERWYDFSISHNQDPHYLRRCAGQIENGLPSSSDPAMG